MRQEKKPKHYRVRYKVEVGDFVPNKSLVQETTIDVHGRALRTLCSLGDYGYAENDIVVVSIASGSTVVLASDGGFEPSRAVLEHALEAIRHMLEHHCEGR